MLLSVTEIVHAVVRPHLKPGDAALDGTAGNGHDTLFLAQCVGPTGRVLAWDIQPLAVERTAALLAQHGVTWAEVMLGSHVGIEELPRTGFAAAMFNLGYLPRSDRSVATTAAGSVLAIRATAERLAAGGILTVLAYTAHPGGAEEAEAVSEVLRGMPADGYDFREEAFAPGRAAPPRLFVLRRHGVAVSPVSPTR